MKIGLVFNKNHHQYDYEAEFDGDQTIQALKTAFPVKDTVTLIESTKNMELFVKKLVSSQLDIIFNVAEGYAGPSREAFYPSLFEQLNLQYCGPDATNLLICHNKFLVKSLLRNASLPVVKGYICRDGKIDPQQLQHLVYPLFVKLNSEGSGMGISPKSIVESYSALKGQVSDLWKKYQKHILIEEYIPGRDMSMVFIEGLGALGPCEVTSSDQSLIYDYEHKTSKDGLVRITSPQDLPSEVREKLKGIVKKIAETLDLKGYAKIDFRMDKNLQPFILEVNAQVSYHPEGEFMTCVKAEGWTMKEILHHILTISLKQYQTGNRLSVGLVE